jgi:hypothetical protein
MAAKSKHDTKQDATLAADQRRVLAQAGKVRDYDFAPGIRAAGPPALDADELFHAPAGLAVASGELLEDRALILGQVLAHRRDQQRAPRRPTFALEHAAEQCGIGQRVRDKRTLARFDTVPKKRLG